MIKSYVAIGKNNGELVEVTPLWPRRKEDTVLDKLDGFYISVTRDVQDKPAAYLVSSEEDSAVYGPLILEYVELLGDL